MFFKFLSLHNIRSDKENPGLEFPLVTHVNHLYGNVSLLLKE